MKVNPYAWRLGYNTKEKVEWSSSFKDYSLYCGKIITVETILKRYIKDLIDLKINFNPSKSISILVIVPGVNSISNNILPKAKKKIEDSLSLKVESLRGEFIDKKVPNPYWIATEIKQVILKRGNPLRIINHFLRSVSNFGEIEGILIVLKGRFKAKSKTEKIMVKQGNLRLQSMNCKLSYFEDLIVGKYGTSTVKVVISYS